MDKTLISRWSVTERAGLLLVLAALASRPGVADELTQMALGELKCDGKATTHSLGKPTKTVTLRVANAGECPVDVSIGGTINKPVTVEPMTVGSVTLPPMPHNELKISVTCRGETKKKLCMASVSWFQGDISALDVSPLVPKGKKCAETIKQLEHHNLTSADQLLKLTVTNSGDCPLLILSGVVQLKDKAGKEYPKIENDDKAVERDAVVKAGASESINATCTGEKDKKCAFKVTARLVKP